MGMYAMYKEQGMCCPCVSKTWKGVWPCQQITTFQYIHAQKHILADCKDKLVLRLTQSVG